MLAATIRDMTPLIALPGPRLESASGDSLRGEWPTMPAFTSLLRRARRLPDAPEWRSGAWRQLQGTTDPGLVSVAAAAVPAIPPGSAACFAAPLFVEAGISRVHLPPGGRLLLDAAEEAAWCAAFNQEFAVTGARLHVAAPGGGWLLEASCAHAARDAPPETLAGEALQRQAASDPGQRALRRLGSEIEMWLAAHELNREREARRLQPLSCIWFWGGAQTAAVPPLQVSVVLAAGAAPDAWLAGLARLCAVPVTPAQDWSQARAILPAAGAGDALIVLHADDTTPAGVHWQMLEERWFEPAARALRGRDVRGLRLQVGGSAWQLPDRSPAAWLRWRRGGWQQLVAAP